MMASRLLCLSTTWLGHVTWSGQRWWFLAVELKKKIKLIIAGKSLGSSSGQRDARAGYTTRGCAGRRFLKNTGQTRVLWFPEQRESIFCSENVGWAWSRNAPNFSRATFVLYWRRRTAGHTDNAGEEETQSPPQVKIQDWLSCLSPSRESLQNMLSYIYTGLSWWLTR